MHPAAQAVRWGRSAAPRPEGLGVRGGNRCGLKPKAAVPARLDSVALATRIRCDQRVPLQPRASLFGSLPQNRCQL